MADDEIHRPDGSVVRLTADRWEHIVEGHPELVAWREMAIDIVAQPELARLGRRAHEEWPYGPGDRAAG